MKKTEHSTPFTRETGMSRYPIRPDMKKLQSQPQKQHPKLNQRYLLEKIQAIENGAPMTGKEKCDIISDITNERLRNMQDEIYKEFLEQVWHAMPELEDGIDNIGCENILKSLYEKLLTLDIRGEYLHYKNPSMAGYPYDAYICRLISIKYHLLKKQYSKALLDIEHFFSDEINEKIYTALIKLLGEYFDEN